MEYTIKSLAQLAGISVRTLRYYDEIGLLKPCRINSSGYRIYGETEIDLLQQILFYKSMDMKLEDIAHIIYDPDFDICEALEEHYKYLISKKTQIENLIFTVEKTLSYKKGVIEMSNKEKFEGFKKEKLDENEMKYGKEIREKYGQETIEKSNKKFLNLSEEEFKKMVSIEKEMLLSLKKVIENNDLKSEFAKDVYEKHREWLGFTWPSYTKEAHIGLAQMYIHDERFTKYYNDKVGHGAAQVLHDCIVKYAK